MRRISWRKVFFLVFRSFIQIKNLGSVRLQAFHDYGQTGFKACLLKLSFDRIGSGYQEVINCQHMTVSGFLNFLDKNDPEFHVL